MLPGPADEFVLFLLSMSLKRSLQYTVITALVGGVMVCAPLPAGAQNTPAQFQVPDVDLGLLEIGSVLKLGEEDPRVIAVRLINLSLEFVGVLLLILIVWGGFQYMLSFGNDEKMKRARATIFNAIIGFILILTSWAIVRFVLQSFTEAAAGNGARSLLERFV